MADTKVSTEDESAPGETDKYASFNFNEGDLVGVDWSEGDRGPDWFSGRVKGIHLRQSTGSEVIVDVVDYDHPDWADGRLYDCAPEWLTVLPDF